MDLRPGWTTWRGRRRAAHRTETPQSLPVAREVIGQAAIRRIAHPEERSLPSRRRGVALDCGWGQIVFGQTFEDRSQAAEVLRARLRAPATSASICGTRTCSSPSIPTSSSWIRQLTYRLDLPAGQISAEAARERDDQPCCRPSRRQTRSTRSMRAMAWSSPVGGPATRVASQPGVLHLVASLSTGRVVGTVTVNGPCGAVRRPSQRVLAVVLTVDPDAAPIGLGQALLGRLSAEMTARGRDFVDLSVLSPTTPARSVFTSGWVFVRYLNWWSSARTRSTSGCPSRPAGTTTRLNPYAKIVADEAMLTRNPGGGDRRPSAGELRLTHGASVIHTRESLSS